MARRSGVSAAITTRYEIIRLAGIVVHHARATVLRLGTTAERIRNFIEARFQLGGPPLAWAP